jgi:alpha-glucuronidase
MVGYLYKRVGLQFYPLFFKLIKKQMKNILLLTALFIGFTTTAQYESNIEILNKSCVTPKDSIHLLFNEVEYDSYLSDGVYVYENIYSGESYYIQYTDDNVISTYVEDYNRDSLKDMKECAKNISERVLRIGLKKYYVNEEHTYLVSSSIGLDSIILITATNN